MLQNLTVFTKVKLAGLCLLTSFLSASCSLEEIGAPAEEALVPYTFSFSDFDVSTYDLGREGQNSTSRAIMADTTKYSLLVVDVAGNGDGVQPVVRQNLVKSEALAAVNLSLSLGEHDLYFFCSAKPWAEFNEKDLTLAWVKPTFTLGDCWSSSMSLKVKSGKTQNKDVKLSRCVARVSTQFTDALPNEAKSFNLTLDGGSWMFDIKKNAGKEADMITNTVYPSSSMYGQVDRLAHLFTFVPKGATSAASYTITAYDSIGNLIATYTSADVPLYVNKSTLYKGVFFHSNASAAFDLSTKWGETINKPF